MGEKKSKQRVKKKKLNFFVRMMRQYALSKSSITYTAIPVRNGTLTT